MHTYITKSEQETMGLAEKLASKLTAGDVIILLGDLGAGKTKFTEGFLKHFGLENEISSPTFTIVNEYSSSDINIYHFDLYRLSNINEFYAIGGEEYFDKGICVIEWGEMIEEILPKRYIKISFEKDNDNENIRKINVETFGDTENILDENFEY